MFATIKHSYHKLDVVSGKDGHTLGALAPNLTVGQDRMILDEPIQSPYVYFNSSNDSTREWMVLVESWRDECIPTILIAEPPPQLGRAQWFGRSNDECCDDET